jgi:hypothetical protein
MARPPASPTAPPPPGIATVSARRGGASWTPARAPPLRFPGILHQRLLHAVEARARFPTPAGLAGELCRR